MAQTVTVKDLDAALRSNTPPFLVDVRETSEYRREHIRQANLFPSSAFAPKKVFEAAGSQNLYVICASGGRSSQMAKMLVEWNTLNGGKDGHNKTIYNVSGGMSAWRAAGLPMIEDKRAPLPIIRQVHIIASSMIIAGSLLGRFYNPNFFLLPVFAGCGLMLSGVTGFCGMALILQKLPYNK